MYHNKKEHLYKVSGSPSKSLLRSPGNKSALDLSLSGKKKEIHFREKLVGQVIPVERPQTPILIRSALKEGTLMKKGDAFFNDYDVSNQPLREFIEKENYHSVESNVKTERLESDRYVSVLEWHDPAKNKTVSRFSFQNRLLSWL